MKKIITAIVCAVLMVSPFIAILCGIKSIPAQYDETFLSVLTKKHERLRSIEEPKIVLIGGSSLAFGLDSELLQDYTGMPCVNYGLYAAIGTKAMLDMSEKYIEKGDIVVICPEVQEQTYSLYYNGESMWQAIDSDMDMLFDVKASNYGKLIAASPEFFGNKVKYSNNPDIKPEGSGIYTPESFNKFGDISVKRQYNEMITDHDASMPVSVSKSIIGEGFIDYLNSYAKRCERKGARVFFSFSPINKASVVSTSEEKEEFFRYLGESLDFPIISDIDSYILSSAYFYDTNFHLNTRGAMLRTALIADDIRREMGITEHVETVKYSAPKRPEDYFASEDDEKDKLHESYLVCEAVDGGMSLKGLTDEGKKQKTITIPLTYGGKPIVSIGEKAFSGGIVETVKIPENTNLTSFLDRAFADCKTLKRIENNAEPSKLTPSADAFDGMNAGCYIYVPKENIGAFSGDYFWGGRMNHVKEME